MKLFKIILFFSFSFFLLSSCTLTRWQDYQLSLNKKVTLRHLSYGKYRRNVYDITLPTNRSKEKTPVIIFIHGGAWIAGNKGQFISEVQKFADAGFACVSINYRFASRNKHITYQEILNDIPHLIDNISDQSEKWKISNTSFGMVGHSAGGHLALMYAYTMNTDKKIKACASWSGPLNFIDSTQLSIGASHKVLTVLIGTSLETAGDTTKYKKASPYWVADTNSTPTLLIYGKKDIGVPYSNAVCFKNKLDSLGVTNSLETLDCGHIFTGKNLQKARELTLEWFKSKL
jgi:acetyl esterase/lipase